MYLEYVEIEGFKSYRDKAKIGPLDSRFTAITGLNGTGKSNILDSLCFVLGIDCPGLLRCGSMKSLIFKSAQSTKGDAKVTLVFNNKDTASSPLGYEEMDTITITRIILEEGKTKYLLNGHNATTKSILRLLQCIGLSCGKNNYSRDGTKRYTLAAPPYFIVMQGRVSKILNMKSTQFLSLLEECAGTSIYRAEKYKAYAVLEKKEKKLLETQETLSKTIFPFLERLRSEREEFYRAKEAKKQVVELSKSLDKYKQAIVYLKNKEIEQEIENLEKNSKELEKKIEHLSVSLVTSQEGIEDIDIIGVQEQIDAKKRKVSALLLDALVEERVKIRDDLDKQNAEIKTALEEYHKLPLLIHPKNEENIEEIMINIEANIEGVSEREKVLVRKEAGTNRISRIDKEREKESMLSKIDNSTARLEEINSQIETIEVQYGLTKEKAENYMCMHRKYEPENIVSLKRQLQEAKAKVTYPQMEGVYGKLGELISIPQSKHIVPICIVLGGKKDFIVVENESVGKKVIEIVSAQGRRIDVIPLSKIVSRTISSQKEDACKRYNGVPLIKTIEYSPLIAKAVQYVFGGYILAPERKSAILLRDKESLTSVTLDGELFDRRGTITGGSIDHLKLSLPQSQSGRIKKLEEQIKNATETLSECSFEMLRECKKYLALLDTQKDIQQMLQKVAAQLQALSEKDTSDTDALSNTTALLSILSGIQQKLKPALEIKNSLTATLMQMEEDIKKIRKESEILQNEIDTLEKDKIEGIKRNERNRARRSMQIREEKRITEEISQCRKEKSKNDLKISKLSQKLEKEIDTPSNTLLEQELSTLIQVAAEIEAKYNHCIKIPQRDINPKNIEMLERNEALEKTLKEKIIKLQKNKETIQRSIEKLDNLERESIESIFKLVNKRLGKYVQYFIASGDARLEAVNDSPINGVELLVKMGTWKKGLTELSGGQKSICALSLIFALLKAKPSPLYILDEIDAALDASHTEAMGRMIQSEFQGSQFLVVSLKDGMYHNANALFQTYLREGTSCVQKI